jgi:hypothetical protein
MNTYEVRFNVSKFHCDTLEEAEKTARELIEPSCPFDAKIVEIDEEGGIVRTVMTLNSTNAAPSTED